MADNLYFARDTKFYVEMDGTLWDIPILADYSFSQATTTSEIGLDENEAPDGTSRRGVRVFNDALDPAEWSVQTYLRPFRNGSRHSDVSEVLWALLMGANKYDSASGAYWRERPDAKAYAAGITTKSTDGVAISTGAAGPATANAVSLPSAIAATFTGTNSSRNAGGTIFDFGRSNRGDLGTATLYFVERPQGGDHAVVYQIDESVVNEATLDFPTDGIATVSWSGFGKQVTDITDILATASAAPASDAGGVIPHADLGIGSDLPAVGDPLWVTAGQGKLYLVTAVSDSDSDDEVDSGDTVTVKDPIIAGTTDTSNLIRNRVSTMIVDGRDADSSNPEAIRKEYKFTLTGGSLTISNNVTYLTPEEIGKVNVPLGHITGFRSVSGEFNCYVVDNSEDGTKENRSADLFKDMVEASTGIDLEDPDNPGTPAVVTEFNVRMQVGGGTKTPQVEFQMPQCSLQVPTHSIEDVISMTTGYTALPTSVSAADEMSVTFVGATS